MNLAHWLAAQRGRQSALAAHLRIKPPQVAAWVSGKRQVPLEHCPFIQAFSGGAVTCEELRPDAAEYFALIRRQAANDAPPAAPVDRRVDHATAAVYTNTLTDRRMAAGEG